MKINRHVISISLIIQFQETLISIWQDNAETTYLHFSMVYRIRATFIRYFDPRDKLCFTKKRGKQREKYVSPNARINKLFDKCDFSKER